MVSISNPKSGGGGGGSEPAPVDSVNGKIGAVVLTAADVSADPAGSASGAQSYAVQRVNHTGTQEIGTVDGLDAAIAAAKARANHTGEQVISTITGLETTLGEKAVRTNVVTGGATRVAGGAFHFWNDPATDPGTNAQAGDVWVGDLA